jgi:hypothetical protein
VQNFNAYSDAPWRRGLVVSSLPVIKEIGAMGREIESHQRHSGGGVVLTKKSVIKLPNEALEIYKRWGRKNKNLNKNNVTNIFIELYQYL